MSTPRRHWGHTRSSRIDHIRSQASNRGSLQSDLRTALGPGTQYIGVTEAILRVVACADPTRPPRYCDPRNASLDRRHRQVA